MAGDALVFDERPKLGATPGLHAILIGVSEYAFLPDAEDPPGEGLEALKRLRSPASAAAALFAKLKAMDAEGRLLRPLKTVRLLIAPSAAELAEDPTLATLGATPECEAIREALWDWRDDVSKLKEEQALFYYGGHGIRRSLEESILLASDFLAPRDVKLAKAFHLSHVRNGMVPSETFPNIGRDQFYLVDACRDKPDALDALDSTQARKMFDPDLNTDDYRSAPIFFATNVGNFAAGPPGKPTFFMQAFLKALDSGSYNAVQLAEVGRTVWPMTAQSLKSGIEAANALFQGRTELTGLVGDPVLCHRNDAPSLTLTLDLQPATTHGNIARLALRDVNDDSESDIVRADPAAPWTREIRAGNYKILVEGVPGSFPPVKTSAQFFNIQIKMPWGVTIGANP